MSISVACVQKGLGSRNRKYSLLKIGGVIETENDLSGLGILLNLSEIVEKGELQQEVLVETRNPKHPIVKKIVDRLKGDNYRVFLFDPVKREYREIKPSSKRDTRVKRVSLSIQVRKNLWIDLEQWENIWKDDPRYAHQEV